MNSNPEIENLYTLRYNFPDERIQCPWKTCLPERGKIYQDLWRLSWPVMIFMVFQTTLELVDLYWVGYSVPPP